MLRRPHPLALRALRRNVLRSALTMLGIVIGVAAVIAMVTLGNGATAQVSRGSPALGTNLLLVHARRSAPGSGGARRTRRAFKLADVQAIEREISGAVAVAPVDTTALQAIAADQQPADERDGQLRRLPRAGNWQLGGGPHASPKARSARARRSACIGARPCARSVRTTRIPVGRDPARQALVSVIGAARRRRAASASARTRTTRARAAALAAAPARRQQRRQADLRRRRATDASTARASRRRHAAAAPAPPAPATAATTSRSAT